MEIEYKFLVSMLHYYFGIWSVYSAGLPKFQKARLNVKMFSSSKLCLYGFIYIYIIYMTFIDIYSACDINMHCLL